MIDLGINRLKYASEIIIALMSELKEASIAGKCNTLVVIDGYNTFFTETTRIFNDNKVMMLPEKISLTIAFLDITKHDWCNGAVVLSVDQLAVNVRTQFFLYTRFLFLWNLFISFINFFVFSSL